MKRKVSGDYSFLRNKSNYPELNYLSKVFNLSIKVFRCIFTNKFNNV